MSHARALGLPHRFKRLAPPVLGALLLASSLLVFGSRGQEFLGWIVAYMVPPLGKESVIPALLHRGYPGWLVFTYILGLDILGGLVVVWNYDRILQLPRVGPVLARVQARWERDLRERPWMRNLTFTGVVLYIAVPLQGSGGLAGSLLGLTLGMRPYRVLLAVILGSALASFLVVNISSLVLLALGIGWSWAALVLVGAAMVAYSVVMNARRHLGAGAS